MRIFLLFLFLYFYSTFLFAQAPREGDSLRLSLKEAETMFVQKNLPLLAQKYEIELAKADVIQSKLYQNPLFYYEQNGYNPLHKNIPLDISGSSQIFVSVQQLVLLAGKRKKRIEIAEIESEKTEYVFKELLRTLSYDLRSTYFKVYFELQKINLYRERIFSIRDLVRRYENQAQKGNVPINEVTRLKALLFEMENERLSLTDDLAEGQKLLALYLQLPPGQMIIPQSEAGNSNVRSPVRYSFDSLYSIMTETRGDLRYRQTDIRSSESNYRYQKSLAVPDLNFQVSYDRAASFVPNYIGVGMGLNLPVFNRNQGGIQRAKVEWEQSKIQYEQTRQILGQELALGLRKLNLADSLFKTFDKKFDEDFEKLLTGTVSSYEKRNISLIEFLDYYQKRT